VDSIFTQYGRSLLLAVQIGLFDSFPTSLFVLSVAFAILYYHLWKRGIIQRVYNAISNFVERYTAMPTLSKGEVLPLFWQLIKSNWYTFLLLVVLWILIFEVDAGSDLIVSYIDEIHSHCILRFASLYLLFIATLAITLAIWTVPFYLYSKAKIAGIKISDRNARKFYIGLRIMALIAILPFLIITNGFFFRQKIRELPYWEIIAVNVAVMFLLAVVEALLFNNRQVKRLLKTWSDSLICFIKRYLTSNYYFILLIQLLLLEAIYVLLIGLLSFTPLRTNYLVALFMLVSGVSVFRLLFFTDGTTMTPVQIWARACQFIGSENTSANRVFYNGLLIALSAVILFFFVTPTLTEVNTVYVVLFCFGFLIIFVDLCRYWTAADSLRKNAAGYVGILFFLIAPLISPDGQFAVPLQRLEFASSADTIRDPKMGLGSRPVAKDRLLMSALTRRVKYIDSLDKTPNSNIYIVCAMGGGSRAGYFTAGVLQAIDDTLHDFLNHTLLYSTISGGSVGTYHYLKRKIAGQKADERYLKDIYGRNYNTSGMYGLLIGDALEGALGGIIGKLKKWTGLEADSAAPYRDRNVRIRQEYDRAMIAALERTDDDQDLGWVELISSKAEKPDAFQGFFYKHKDAIPIHLVNTFEINTGRRTVLSPFIADDTAFFSNAIIPLQDTMFSATISRQDISYREAVNMSELFPFLSAASSIGDSATYQFVDGGYFENYGLATAFDIIHCLSEKPELAKRLRIVLIKNSLQRPVVEQKTRQLIAPIVGVLNAPFTGHANHFLQDGRKRFPGRFVTIEFNEKSDSSRVSLTRALTAYQMTAMSKQAIEQVKKKVACIAR